MATSQTLGFLICDVFVFVSCIIVAFIFSFKLTLVMLATGIPSALILWGISRFVDPAIEGQKRQLSEASKHATAATTGIDLVKVYNGADNESFRFMSAIRRSGRYYLRQVLCNCGQMSYIKLWMLMLFVVGFFFAVLLVNSGDLTPGDALTTFYAALIAFQSVETLGPHWLVLAKGMVSGQLLKTLVNESSDQHGRGDKGNGWYRPMFCRGEIQIRNVSFDNFHIPLAFFAILIVSQLNHHYRSLLHIHPTPIKLSFTLPTSASQPERPLSWLAEAAPARAPWVIY